jgi:hypothetical protein
MKNTTMKVAMTLVGFALMAGQCRASLVTYLGEDLQPTANPTVRTNSDAAAAAFAAAASAFGPISTITFESAPLGSFSNLVVAPGVAIDGSDLNNNPQTIRDTTNFPSYPSVDGSNTTLGGSVFVEVFGGQLNFSFAQPVQSFGLYLTGVQTVFFGDSIAFSDGTFQFITIPGVGTASNVGETVFIGFTDIGKSIPGFSVIAGFNGTGQDAIGVDDVSFQLAPVPEPSTFVMSSIVLGMFGVAGLGKRMKKIIAAA